MYTCQWALAKRVRESEVVFKNGWNPIKAQELSNFTWIDERAGIMNSYPNSESERCIIRLAKNKLKFIPSARNMQWIVQDEIFSYCSTHSLARSLAQIINFLKVGRVIDRFTGLKTILLDGICKKPLKRLQN